jgi:hypothetical protein
MSDPSLSFIPLSTDIGTVDVGTSTAYFSYHIKNKSGNKSAVNMSIFMTWSNATAQSLCSASWFRYSSALETARVGVSTATQLLCGTVNATSLVIKHKTIVPSTTGLSGRQAVYGKHKYQFT